MVGFCETVLLSVELSVDEFGVSIVDFVRRVFRSASKMFIGGTPECFRVSCDPPVIPPLSVTCRGDDDEQRAQQNSLFSALSISSPILCYVPYLTLNSGISRLQT